MKKIENIYQIKQGKYYKFINLWGEVTYEGICTKEMNPDDDTFEGVVITELDDNGDIYVLNEFDVDNYAVFEYDENKEI
jgi:hypothetical protein